MLPEREPGAALLQQEVRGRRQGSSQLRQVRQEVRVRPDMLRREVCQPVVQPVELRRVW
ncbi:hypothetical protein LINGRAHAP2_LOCUS12563 [Linum grandiflorum]